MKLEFSGEIFEEYSNIKFYEDPSSGSLVVPYGQTDRQTDIPSDITKLIVAFRNFAKAPEDEIRNLRNCNLSAQSTIFRPILHFNVTS
jgi:hypothetical protein